MAVHEAEDLYRTWTIEPVIVAVTDTGVHGNHPDLLPALWTNVDEVPGDGVDNDSNGYVDDLNGWDFVNDDNDPDDTDGHGTHVAGIIGAIVNNGLGIAGIAPNAVLMPLQFLDGSGTGYTDDVIDAIAYAAGNGARAINASWGDMDQRPVAGGCDRGVRRRRPALRRRRGERWKRQRPPPRLPGQLRQRQRRFRRRVDALGGPAQASRTGRRVRGHRRPRRRDHLDHSPHRGPRYPGQRIPPRG